MLFSRGYSERDSLKLCYVSLFSLLLLIFVLGGKARAELYKYVDENGVVHFTNVPTDRRFKPVDGTGSSRHRRSRRKNGQVFRHVLVDKYNKYVCEASKRFNIPRELILAVMAVESNFDPRAVSSAGAQGLMQLMPATALQMDVEDPFDPYQSILGGTRYLRTMANVFSGDMVLTLAAYNAGQQAVTRHMDIPPYDETQRYVRRVLKLYSIYKKMNKRQSGSNSVSNQSE